MTYKTQDGLPEEETHEQVKGNRNYEGDPQGKKVIKVIQADDVGRVNYTK